MYLFLGTFSLLERFLVPSVKLVYEMILYVDEFQEEIVSEQFEESQGLYNQQMHVNVQRNLREGVWVRGWVSESENGGEI